MSVRGLKSDILVYAFINCRAEADIITLSLLVCSGLNHDRQKLGGYKTLNY